MVEQLSGLLALIILLVGIVLILGSVALAIYPGKKTVMIEKELVPEDEKTRSESRVGWVIALLGIVISLIVAIKFNYNNYTIGRLILAYIGIALLISLLVSYKISKQQK